MKKRVSIFGSTGTIGCMTLNIIRKHPDLFEVTSLIAGTNIKKLMEQIDEFHPKYVYIKSKSNYHLLKEKYHNINVYYGLKGMNDISLKEDYDIGVSALVGIAGLQPTYNMIKKGKTILLANKEVLVTGGEYILKASKKYKAKLLTIDSEHSAIMQCLNGEDSKKIHKILLTASGGPFFDKKIHDGITPEEALGHPTWQMGPKITIDSSTMMNKGFEVIEAKWLFGVNPENIEVYIHRDSYVHSMVEFIDGTIMANIAPRSMEIPIAYALNYPNRMSNDIEKLDLFQIQSLEFQKPNYDKFPCLTLAYKAIQMGHSAQVVLNAADEVLVDSFLKGQIKYTDIPKYIKKMLEEHQPVQLKNIKEILQLDKKTRQQLQKRLLEEFQ